MPLDPTVYPADNLPDFTVVDNPVDTTLLGGLGTIGDIAGGAGLFFQGMDAIGNLFMGGDYQPGLSSPGSIQGALNTGEQTNTWANPTGVPTDVNQQIYQQLVSSGMSPTDAQSAVAQYSSAIGSAANPMILPGMTVTGAGTAASAIGSGLNIPASIAAAGAGLGVGSLLATGGGPGVVDPGTANLTGSGGAGNGGTSTAGANQYGDANTGGAGTGGSGVGQAVAAGTGGGIGGLTAQQISSGIGLLTGAGGIIKGLTGGTNATAPNAGDIGGQILQDEVNFAPSIYQTTQQYAPAYSQLQSQMLNQQGQNLLAGYQGLAPGLQSLQTYLNQQQGIGNIGMLQGLGGQAVSAYQGANPQLQALQNAYTQMALSGQNPISSITGAGGWGNTLQGQIAGTMGANRVQAGMTSPNMMVAAPQNGMLGQLGNTASQQLALGTSISPQEQQTVANQVLSTYNSMGRANDPIAVANLATGLDTYGQQLLQQREGAAATAAGLTTNQGALGLSAGQSNLAASQQSALANQAAGLQAQQANLSGGLGALGISESGLAQAGSQQLQAAQSNQYGQLQNAQYQQGLLNGASQLAYNSAAPAMSMLLGQSQGLTNAYNTTAQGGTSLQSAMALSGMYNPFNSAAYGPAYNAQSAANLTNTTTNAGLIGGGMSMIGGLLGNSSFLNALSSWF